MQRQTSVTAYFSSKKLLLFAFAGRSPLLTNWTWRLPATNMRFIARLPPGTPRPEPNGQRTNNFLFGMPCSLRLQSLLTPGVTRVCLVYKAFHSQCSEWQWALVPSATRPWRCRACVWNADPTHSRRSTTTRTTPLRRQGTICQGKDSRSPLGGQSLTGSNCVARLWCPKQLNERRTVLESPRCGRQGHIIVEGNPWGTWNFIEHVAPAGVVKTPGCVVGLCVARRSHPSKHKTFV